MGELDRAFERGIPGTQQLVQAEVQKVQERQAAEFEDSLVKAGLERKPDGSIGNTNFRSVKLSFNPECKNKCSK